MPPLTGGQYKQLVDTILDGFDQSSLQQLLLYDLNVQLDHIVGSGNFNQLVFEVVRWVQAQGLLPNLLTAMEKARPQNQAVLQTVKSLRQALGLEAPPATVATRPATAAPTYSISQFPRTGMIPPDQVPLSFISVFSQLYPTADAITRAVSAANQARRATDADDPTVRTIDLNDIPNAGAVGPLAAWTNILLQACRHGSRMVAALVLAAPADAFGEDRNRFLKNLQNP